MKQSDQIDNYQKFIDESVELVLLVDMKEDSYELMHNSERMIWSLEKQGSYSSFIKYIEKHIEEEEQKQDIQKLFSLQYNQENQIWTEPFEKEYRITMQGRYENISLLRYRMEEIPGYEHTGILVIRLLTEVIENKKKQTALYQIADYFCNMAIYVELEDNQIAYLVIPEYIKKAIVNLPKSFEGFVHEFTQKIHIQDQEIIYHILSRSYLEAKFAEKDEFTVQTRCKSEDDSFYDIDIICRKAEIPLSNETLQHNAKTSFVLMIKNISEEKKMIEALQQEIQQLEGKLEAAKEEKEELCSMIAKELHKRS